MQQPIHVEPGPPVIAGNVATTSYAMSAQPVSAAYAAPQQMVRTAYAQPTMRSVAITVEHGPVHHLPAEEMEISSTREDHTEEDDAQTKKWKAKVVTAGRQLHAASASEGPLQAGIQDLAKFITGLPDMAKLIQTETISLATTLRNAISRSIWNVAKCWDLIQKLSDISEEVNEMLHEVEDVQLFSKVEIINDMVKVATNTVPLFTSLLKLFEQATKLFNEVQDKVAEYCKLVQHVTVESVERVNEDLAKMREGVKAMMVQAAVTVRSQTAKCMLAIGNLCNDESRHPRQVHQVVQARGVDSGILSHEPFTALLTSMIGNEGIKLLFDLMVTSNVCGGQLKKSHEDMKQKIEALKEEPHGAWEWMVSPITKTYQAANVAQEFQELFLALPGIWKVMSRNIINFKKYCDRLRQFWEDLFTGFMQVVSDVCAKFGITLSLEFTDESIVHIDFDPVTAKFVPKGCYEHIMELSNCSCCIGAKEQCCIAYAHCYWGIHDWYSRCFWDLHDKYFGKGGKPIRTVRVIQDTT